MKITAKDIHPSLILAYQKKRKRVAGTSTYSFSIFRPNYPNSNEIHVIFNAHGKEDMSILVLPPILHGVLLVTWQNTWQKLLEVPTLKPGERITVADNVKKSTVLAVIRSLRTWLY